MSSAAANRYRLVNFGTLQGKARQLIYALHCAVLGATRGLVEPDKTQTVHQLSRSGALQQAVVLNADFRRADARTRAPPDQLTVVHDDDGQFSGVRVRQDNVVIDRSVLHDAALALERQCRQSLTDIVKNLCNNNGNLIM